MELPFEHLHANFASYSVPSLLENLLAFQIISPEYYAGRFELEVITQDALKHHIEKEALPQFFGFGRESDDSLYALWRYKEVPLEEAPVVYLNTEGEGSGVQANNLGEFLTILAYDQGPVSGIYVERPSTERKHTKRNREFLIWLEQHYHLHATEHPNDLVRQARFQHPAVPLLY